MIERRANVSGPRIVVIGGGSQFAIGLSESLVDYGRDFLVGATVVLLDVHDDHLRIVEDYASRLARSMGANMRFEATTDRRAAFAGADYLLTTFRPGSHDQLIQDETVPVKHGLQGNETVGIGGIFMACRVAPVLREICADAQELCPDAWIINYTNPTQFVADAVQRISDMRIISLCDGYVGDVDTLAYVLDVDPSAITIQVAGTNHAMWMMAITVDGEDGYPLLRKRLADQGSRRCSRPRPRRPCSMRSSRTTRSTSSSSSTTGTRSTCACLSCMGSSRDRATTGATCSTRTPSSRRSANRVT
jgi:6-phospho-beta-glucosidase